MLPKSIIHPFVAGFWALCLGSLATVVACSNEAPAPTPPKQELHFTSTGSQGLSPSYKIQIFADSASWPEVNTSLGLIPENAGKTVNLARLTNRSSYSIYLLLYWGKVIKGAPTQPPPNSTIKAELLLNDQVKRTLTLTATNGQYAIPQACMFCTLDEMWLIVDRFTVKQ